MATTGVIGTVTGTTGVIGGRWRGDVTGAGNVVPWDGSAPLRWFVAADDRWHDPAADNGVRHRRIDGAAVFETRVRIPSGDAVQRAWSVADAGGVTVVEVTNESPLPIACAFTRGDLLTRRPPTRTTVDGRSVDELPIATSSVAGVDLPTGTVVLPVGHRSTITVGLPHRDGRRADEPGALPERLATSEATARGWVGRCDAASRLDLPDAARVDAVRAVRCELMLAGLPDVSTDPARFLLGAAELWRLGELGGDRSVAITPEVVRAVEQVARAAGPLSAAALDAAGVVLAAAGEERARRDLAGIRQRLAVRAPAAGGGTDPSADAADAGDVAMIASVERTIAAGTVLFPAGIPHRWLGQDLEAHGLLAGPATRLSIALRWHGPNVAVLWEREPAARQGEVEEAELTSGVDTNWTAREATGEALWRLETTPAI